MNVFRGFITCMMTLPSCFLCMGLSLWLSSHSNENSFVKLSLIVLFRLVGPSFRSPQQLVILTSNRKAMCCSHFFLGLSSFQCWKPHFLGNNLSLRQHRIVGHPNKNFLATNITTCIPLSAHNKWSLQLGATRKRQGNSISLLLSSFSYNYICIHSIATIPKLIKTPTLCFSKCVVQTAHARLTRELVKKSRSRISHSTYTIKNLSLEPEIGIFMCNKG